MKVVIVLALLFCTVWCTDIEQALRSRESLAQASKYKFRNVYYPNSKSSKADTSADTYTVKEGYLAAGDDLFSGSYTVSQAQTQCDNNADCLGFTFESNTSTPSGPVDVYFKSVINYVSGTGWWSDIKTTGPAPPPDVNFTVGGLNVELRSGSHSVQNLLLQHDTMPPYNFSWVPPLTGYDRPDRSQPKCHQLGDITIRIQPITETNETSWALFSSAWAGSTTKATPISKSDLPANAVAGDDITPLLNATPSANRIEPQYPLSVNVLRIYEIFTDSEGNQSLVIRFNLTATAPIRLGGFGISLPADDNTNNLQLNQIAYINSFVDPHIGGDWAFAEWTRVIGNTTMVVLPHTPNTRMEAWRPLMEDCNFDGSLSEWTVISGAWASEWDLNDQAPIFSMPTDLASTGVWPNPQSPWPEWHGSETFRLTNMRSRYWNPASIVEMTQGQQISFALRFVLTPSGPRSRDDTLLSAGVPMFESVPGYTISTDMASAKLFVQLPPSLKILNISVSPSDILSIGQGTTVATNTVEYPVKGMTRGRARVSVFFSDQTEGVAHYYVLPSLPTQISNLGSHWQNVAWLPRDYQDQFGRSASVMPWDREDGVHVLQDSRAYIVGLSDDAGAANNLGMAMKVNWAPTQDQVTRVDDYIKWTLYGVKSDTADAPLRSLQGRPEDGSLEDQIRMTLYYYCNNPGSCTAAPHWPYNYTEQDKCYMPVGGPIWCMNEQMADSTYRAYNYPHQVASYWAMYRIARNYDKFTTYQTWNWYLERAYRTVREVGSPDVGLMDGTVFREVLYALQYEGATNSTIMGWANTIQSNMKKRADGWSTQEFPYGSEFNYDTTGQEEVYVWLTYFNYTSSAAQTLQSILGYMRKFPNWAWNGGARSMGDLGNNGKWFINRGTERVLMHYRAGLNMIPLIEAYRANPDDLLLLEISMGAMVGQLTNIDESGATSMGFHSYPFVLEHDPHSGDYGLGFFGHTLQAGSYPVLHPQYSWQCYLCDILSSTSTSIQWAPRDSYRVRTYVERLGVYLVAETGNFQEFSLDLSGNSLQITFVPLGSGAGFSYLQLEVKKEGKSRPGANFAVYNEDGSKAPVVRGAYQIIPNSVVTQTTVATLKWTS